MLTATETILSISLIDLKYLKFLVNSCIVNIKISSYLPTYLLHVHIHKQNQKHKLYPKQILNKIYI